MDPDESDVVHSDLVYSSIAVTIDFLMITQFNTVVTGDVGKERLLTELKAGMREVWCDQSITLRRLTLNSLSLISVPGPKLHLNPFSYTAISRACLVMQMVRINGVLSFVSP